MKTASKLLIASSLLAILFLYFGGSKRTHDSDEKRIRAVLETQVEQWNKGDIPAFMETYVKSDKLRFSSGGTVQRGWDATLERYLTRYPSPDAMGRLEFEELQVKILSDTWAEVHGRYRLYRDGDYANAIGLFTLLMENTSVGWKILHDHSSSDPNK